MPRLARPVPSLKGKGGSWGLARFALGLLAIYAAGVLWVFPHWGLGGGSGGGNGIQDRHAYGITSLVDENGFRSDEAEALRLAYGQQSADREEQLYLQQSMREEEQARKWEEEGDEETDGPGREEEDEEERRMLEESLQEMKAMLRAEEDVIEKFNAHAQRQRLADAVQLVERNRQKERDRQQAKVAKARERANSLDTTGAAPTGDWPGAQPGGRGGGKAGGGRGGGGGGGGGPVPGPERLVGVRPGQEGRYCCTSRKGFRCKDGTEIDCDRVNDDYCDCPDGDDEPGTAACAGHGGRFFCQADHKSIPAGRVRDGVCDCCDGSDEGPGGGCKQRCKGKRWPVKLSCNGG